MKHSISTLLTVLLLAVLLILPFATRAEAAVVASGTFGADTDNLSWTLDDEGLLTIFGTGNMGCIDGKGAANPWESYLSDITAVIIQPGVANISDYAFNFCGNMSTISIPDSVQSIGNGAFAQCDSLTHITIPKGVTQIGRSTFSYCDGLTSISIPDSVTSIGDYAFYNSEKLKTVTIPASVTSIGYYAFYCFCESKTLIFLGDIPSIDSYAFYSLYLTAYYPSGNATWSDDALQKYGANSLDWYETGKLHDLNVSYDSNLYVGDSVTKQDLTITAVYANGARANVHPSDYTLSSCDTSTPGKKTVMVSYKGMNSTLAFNVHNGGLVTVNADRYPESKHNYAHNSRETQTITVEGAQKLDLYFSTDTFVEQSCDYIDIYDSSDTLIKSFTGSTAAGSMVSVPGNVAKIRLISDSSGNGYGYSFSKIVAHIVEHDMKSVAATAATCTEPGYSAGSRCSICDFTDDIVETEPALGHSIGENGSCERCGRSMNNPIYCLAPERWDTVWVYTWTEDEYIEEGSGSWPGKEMISLGDGIYVADMLLTMENIIFHHYESGEQTADLVIPLDKRNFYDVAADTWSYYDASIIIQQPTSVTVANGETAKVTVGVVGENLTFQWYYAAPGSDEFKLTTSFKSNSYFVTMNEARAGRQVYCVITDADGNSVATNTVTLNMIAPVKIVKQPTNVATTSGSMANVTLTAVGNGLTYKWYYANKGSDTFTLTNSFKSDSYYVSMNASRNGRRVYCVVTDQYGNSVKSNIVTISMMTPLKITKQPTNQLVLSGQTAKISLTATGDGLTYKWYYANAGVSRFSLTKTFTSNSYSLVMNATRAGRRVYCVVTDKYGNSVTTNIVTLSMKTPLQITTAPDDVAADVGQTATVTIGAKGDGLTYKWYYANKGSKVYTLTNAFTSNTYAITMNAARNGRKVFCVITDKYGNSVATEPVTLTMGEPLRITAQPTDAFAANGKTAKITFNVKGEGLTFQWYFANAGSNIFTETASFKSNSYAVTMNDARDGRRVFCVITDKDGNSVVTNIATLHMT